MNISAVLFDMDGLLIDSERIALGAFQTVCKPYPQVDPLSLYLQVLGTNQASTRTILQHALPAPIDVDHFMSQWLALYNRETANPVPLMPGVLSLLDYLEQHGIPAAVATSTHTEQAQHKLANSGILHRFVTLTGGDQVANGKPAPDIYLKAATSIGQDPALCLALEDSPNGVRSALAAGTQVIQIPQLVEPDASVRALGHRIVKSLDAVMTELERSR